MVRDTLIRRIVKLPSLASLSPLRLGRRLSRAALSRAALSRATLSLAALSLAVLSFMALAASLEPPNLEQTLAAQQRLVAERPNDAQVHNDHGNLLVLAGRLEEAADAYRQAIALAPSNTLARYNLGVLLQQTEHEKEARAEFRSLLEIDPRHARTYYQLGMLFHARKQRAKAIEHYARAFAYDPELTFPAVNPHLIDNELATEALLVSRRYNDAPSAAVPRLYGEPERIAGMMLAGPAASAAGALPEADQDEKGEGEDTDADGKFSADDPQNGPHDEASRAGAKPGNGNRRALRRGDLDTATSVGIVQQAPNQPSRRSSAGREARRPSAGRGGVPAVRPGGNPAAAGTLPGDSAPRYRPTSRLSTGRLELHLLPADAPPARNAATATR